MPTGYVFGFMYGYCIFSTVVVVAVHYDVTSPAEWGDTGVACYDDCIWSGSNFFAGADQTGYTDAGVKKPRCHDCDSGDV